MMDCLDAPASERARLWGGFGSLTSFFVACSISVLISFKQLLILARRLFSIIGLLLCKKKKKSIVSRETHQKRERLVCHRKKIFFTSAHEQQRRISAEVAKNIGMAVCTMNRHRVSVRISIFRRLLLFVLYGAARLLKLIA